MFDLADWAREADGQLSEILVNDEMTGSADHAVKVLLSYLRAVRETRNLAALRELKSHWETPAQ
jgi:hypothetical protein